MPLPAPVTSATFLISVPVTAPLLLIDWLRAIVPVSAATHARPPSFAPSTIQQAGCRSQMRRGQPAHGVALSAPTSFSVLSFATIPDRATSSRASVVSFAAAAHHARFMTFPRRRNADSKHA
jgi:hypothetical protein